VKELAKQTAHATGDIRSKIEAIQADTKGSVQAIGTITSIINQIHDLSAAISAAVEEQTATTGEIARNISEGAKYRRRLHEIFPEWPMRRRARRTVRMSCGRPYRNWSGCLRSLERWSDSLNMSERSRQRQRRRERRRPTSGGRLRRKVRTHHFNSYLPRATERLIGLGRISHCDAIAEVIVHKFFKRASGA
jgi:hypothetical protein